MYSQKGLIPPHPHLHLALLESGKNSQLDLGMNWCLGHGEFKVVWGDSAIAIDYPSYSVTEDIISG